MIGLRIAHLIGSLHASAASSFAINLARWLMQNEHDALLLSSGGVREPECQDEGLAVQRYADKGLRMLAGRGRKLLARLTEWKPDVIHVHRLAQVPLGGDLACKLGVPLVVSVHCPIEPDDAETLDRPYIEYVTVPNEEFRAHLVARLGLDRDRVVVLPYGVDMERFARPAPRTGVRTVGTVTRFDDQRDGAVMLIEALASLREQDHDVRGLIVGSGAGHEDLERLIADAGLREVIELQEAGAHIAPALARMDVFAYPFRRDTHSISVIKAMSSQCAVVAAAVGSIQGLVVDGETGLLVPPGDTDALALALGKLVTRPALAARMGQAGRERVADNHDVKKVGKVAHQLYRSAVRGGATRTSGVETVFAYRRLSSDGEA